MTFGTKLGPKIGQCNLVVNENGLAYLKGKKHHVDKSYLEEVLNIGSTSKFCPSSFAMGLAGIIWAFILLIIRLNEMNSSKVVQGHFNPSKN